MKELNMISDDDLGDGMLLKSDDETGDFYFDLCSQQGQASFKFNYHSAKKLQAFLNQNTRKGNRRR